MVSWRKKTRRRTDMVGGVGAFLVIGASKVDACRRQKLACS